MERVDFHVHYENGNTFSPECLFEEAKRNEIVTLALIGRLELSDDLDRYINIGKNFGIEVFTGVEYPVRIGGVLVDLIAVGFDHNNCKIKHLFGKSERKKDNAQVARYQKEFLENKGFVVEGASDEDKELLEKLLGGEISEKAIRFCSIVVQNSQNQKILARLKSENNNLWHKIYDKYNSRPGYTEIQNIGAKFLWTIFFDFGKPGYLPIQNSATNIVDVVHNARGVVLYSPEDRFDGDVWDNLCSIGIDGIMGWHGSKLEINKRLIAEIREKRLLILGGSDFHPQKNEWKVGIGDGNLYINARRRLELNRYIDNMKAIKKI